MRTIDRLSLTLGVTLAALALGGSSGCAIEPETGSTDGIDRADGAEDTEQTGESQAPETTKAPEFAAGQGQAKHVELPYPAAPYGISPGSIIENLKFYGMPNAQSVYTSLGDAGAKALFANGDPDPAKPQLSSEQKLRAIMAPIQLADFYNPTGSDVWPAGAPYSGNKPKALVIVVASVWCAPCNHEAANILPGKYAKYKPLGGEFLLSLADGATPGEPATTRNLGLWTRKYKVDYPGAIDPGYKMSTYFVSPVFPSNFIVDTRTMKIRVAIGGSPDTSFWTAFEKILAETP